jgi:putative oxidoreductase
MAIALWIVQGLLALMFLLAGSRKSFLPLPAVKKSFPWANHVPDGFTRFIGISELLGGLGLVLPAVTGILPWLTIVAALGLAVVMVCAMIFHLSRREFSVLGINLVLLLLALFLVVGRWVLAPL